MNTRRNCARALRTPTHATNHFWLTIARKHRKGCASRRVIWKGWCSFHLKAQLASPGDSTKDASTPWPNSDEVVELGVLTIDKAARDSLEAQKKLLFLPGQLTDGIEPSDDPLIGLRNGAYAVSFSRRNP